MNNNKKNENLKIKNKREKNHIKKIRKTSRVEKEYVTFVSILNVKLSRN